MSPAAPENPRTAFIAILGIPNCGKSTLLNRLVGDKISIVSSKVQTTRRRVRGILTQGNVQLVFMDTPGIFAPKRTLDQAMVQAAWQTAAEADARLLLVDASKVRDGQPDKATAEIIRQLKDKNLPCAIAINKIDTLARDALLPLAAHLHKTGVAQDIYMISALSGDGVERLLADCLAIAKEGTWHYAPDQVSDLSERELAAEITREQLYRQLRQELPYAATVETERYEERADGSVAIWQRIIVARDSQKGIVLGHKGQQLKSIGQAARQEYSALLGAPVHLFLNVGVNPKWDEDKEHLESQGLTLEKV